MPATAHRPNIVFILTDQQRCDSFAAAGAGYMRTPAIDSIARDGVLYERAYTTNPVCSPARASLVTGRYPHAHRVRCNGIPLSDREVTLPAVLGEQGYRTAAVGKVHLTPTGSSGYPESRTSWDDPAMTAWHGPYFGFQHVELTQGHNYPGAHHRAWVRERFPGVYERYGRDNAREVRPGFQSWVSSAPVEAHSSEFVGSRAVAFLERQAKARTSGENAPFFLWAGFPDPHHPFDPPEPYASMYDPAEMPTADRVTEELDAMPPHYRDHCVNGLPNVKNGPPRIPARMSDEGTVSMRALAAGMISLVDRNVGRILNAIRELGFEEDTVVVFTSDHGELLGDHRLYFKGPYFYEQSVRVPCLVKYPRCAAAGVRTQALWSHADLTPTLLDFAGIAAPLGVQGVSQAPVLRGEAETAREWALVEYNADEFPDLNQKCLVTRDRKLTYYGGQPYGELFDFTADPGEHRNVYDDPAYVSERHELTGTLLDVLVETEDPLPKRLSMA
jgi:arylsulfatase A-like enzyme